MACSARRLWARLILHFWALEAERDGYGGAGVPDPVGYLARAFDRTKEAVSKPTEWQGTTTACSALLTVTKEEREDERTAEPCLCVTQLGDSAVMVIRPSDKSTVFRTKEQWHWFDCPRQLGTNSPDVPQENAVLDRVAIREGDVVLAVSDGVLDNLWAHEITENVSNSMLSYSRDKDSEVEEGSSEGSARMRYVALRLVEAAKEIATDPFAESPYMEKAVEEGLSIEGGTRSYQTGRSSQILTSI